MPRPEWWGTERAYARELGISMHKLRKLGGSERLKAMSEDARSFLINYKSTPVGDQMSLAARGFKPFTRGLDSAAAYRVEDGA